MSELPVDQAYIAALWEHPRMCLAFFGVQYRTQEGQRLYEESGVHQEVFPASPLRAIALLKDQYAVGTITAKIIQPTSEKF